MLKYAHCATLHIYNIINVSRLTTKIKRNQLEMIVKAKRVKVSYRKAITIFKIINQKKIHSKYKIIRVSDYCFPNSKKNEQKVS